MWGCFGRTPRSGLCCSAPLKGFQNTPLHNKYAVQPTTQATSDDDSEIDGLSTVTGTIRQARTKTLITELTVGMKHEVTVIASIMAHAKARLVARVRTCGSVRRLENIPNGDHLKIPRWAFLYLENLQEV